MTSRARKRASPSALRGEGLRDSCGRLVDDTYVDGAVGGAMEYVRRRGRPSLSQTGESPLLRVRISHDLDAAVRDEARRSGKSVAEWVRCALADAAGHGR